MHRAGRNEDGLAGLGVMALEGVPSTFPFRKLLSAPPCVTPGFTARRNSAFAIGLEDIPHFALADIARIVDARVLIVRMNLDG